MGSLKEWWCLGGVLGGGGWVVGGDGERDDVMAWTNKRKPVKRKPISSQEYVCRCGYGANPGVLDETFCNAAGCR